VACGDSIALDNVRITNLASSFDKLRGRLESLLSNPSSMRLLSDRSIRHALLYILEARDPEIRQKRISMLEATLTASESSNASLR